MKTKRKPPGGKCVLDDMAGYPGSKGGSGHAERIIRQMPPHAVYVEAFAGTAAVFRKKAPSASSVLIDVAPKCCHRLRSYIVGPRGAAVGEGENRMFREWSESSFLRVEERITLINGDALEILPAMAAVRASNALVYFDPPYLDSTRSKKVLYDFDSKTESFHCAVLDMAKELPCMVMISGYRSELYAKRLRRWRCVEIPFMTHGGRRIDRLWCNFPEPQILHDPRWAGANYRERELIKRRQKRWAAKFANMDPRIRQAVAVALAGVDRASMLAALGSATKGVQP